MLIKITDLQIFLAKYLVNAENTENIWLTRPLMARLMNKMVMLRV